MATLYLDLCCLNRFWDDQSQSRIRLETEALELIFKEIDSGRLRWLVSTALTAEARRCTDLDRRRKVELLLEKGKRRVRSTPRDKARTLELCGMGFKTFDAAHLAFAERGGANVLLTTDDRFENRAKRLPNEIKVAVENPTIWYSNWMRS